MQIVCECLDTATELAKRFGPLIEAHHKPLLDAGLRLLGHKQQVRASLCQQR
jgi:hypothetical protein